MRIDLKISSPVVVGAHTIAPTARGVVFPYFFCVFCGLVPALVRQRELINAGTMAILLMPKLLAAPAPRAPISTSALCRSSGFLLLFTRDVCDQLSLLEICRMMHSLLVATFELFQRRCLVDVGR